MSSSGSEEEDGAGEPWSEDELCDAEETVRPPPARAPSPPLTSANTPQTTHCLFSDELLPTPAAALQRAAEAFGFDFARLRAVRRLLPPSASAQPAHPLLAGAEARLLRLYPAAQLRARKGAPLLRRRRLRTRMLTNARPRWLPRAPPRSQPPPGPHLQRCAPPFPFSSPPPSHSAPQLVASLLASLPAGAWKDDSFLTPVLSDDPLLFGLDDEDEEMEGEPAAEDASSAEELRAENESLKLQARFSVTTTL